MPEFIAPLATLKQHVTICRPLYNPHDKNLHGNGWATLSVQRGNGHSPGGVSLDRLVALETGLDDAFPSIALGVAHREGAAPPCVSADGPRRPFPAIASPYAAHARIFGAGASGADVERALLQERSLLDGMVEDINRVRPKLAIPERVKLEQLLTSYRAMERQLVEQQRILSTVGAPDAPAANIGSTLRTAVVEAHVDVIAHALSFGLTHVAHLSILGFDAHNVGWDTLGFSGDAHEAVMHVARGYDRDRSTAAVQAILSFQAAQLARLYNKLDAINRGSSTLAKQTIFVWVNSGGGKHHEGADWHPILTIGSGNGKLVTDRYFEFGQRPCMSQAFLAIAQTMGVERDTFGDPAHCPGPLEALLA
jgi:predicted transcriptional regulator